MFYMIKGQFGQNGDLNTTKVGQKDHGEPNEQHQFFGLFLTEKDDEGGGCMFDSYGFSELSKVRRTSNILLLTKQYFYADGSKKPTQISYEFAQAEDGTWRGTWQTSTGCNKGIATCKITEVPESFLLPTAP